MCILLVEDEELIREIMTESLRDAGFEVVEASTGDQAVALFAERPKHFSLLVTDFNMPGCKDGAAIAAQMRELMPSLPVVIASGRPEVFRAHWKTTLGYTLLAKPYRPHQLVELARSLLA